MRIEISQPVDTLAAEEARIRSVYARRQEGDRYSWFQPGHVFIIQQRERQLIALLRRCGAAPLADKIILEIGCGSGYWLRAFINWGARPENLTGIDLLADRMDAARRLCPPQVHLQRANAAQLPFADEAFDLVIQSTVFTSILDPELKRRVAAEMLRVVKRDGLIIWYDYHVNNPWNPDVRGVKRAEIAALFRGCRIALRRATLLPPLTRRLAPYSYLACYFLEKIPLLCTHYLAVITKTRREP